MQKTSNMKQKSYKVKKEKMTEIVTIPGQTNVYNDVHIALAADNNYAMPLAVTMTSILANTKKSTRCHFYILIPDDFQNLHKQKILSLCEHYRCHIKFINMGNQFIDFPNSLSHTTNQSYYRLILSDILPNLSKILYLDVDIVVKEDLSDLFSIELGENYFGGVLHPTYYFGNWEGHCKLLRIPNLYSYINAGVLLINLDQIRKDKLSAKLVAAIANDYPAIDQDVINSIAFGRIKLIPFKYNVLIKTASYLKNKEIEKIYDYNEFFQAFQTPVIIHYANPQKPWDDPSLLFASEWFTYYRISPYFEKDKFSNALNLIQGVAPCISVVMATHNRERYLSEAIESILNQTYKNFEFLIVNDASTDDTACILNFYSIRDKRIRIFTNPIKYGISKSRNLAIKYARGKYMAVMDDDDIAMSKRFEIEKDFLDKHSEIAVVGTDIEVFSSGEPTSSNTTFWKKSWVLPMNYTQSAILMISRNYICHSSTLIRLSFLKQYQILYNEKLFTGVDYDLWMQILLKAGKICNLPSILQRYRVHPASITATKTSRKDQDLIVDKVRQQLLLPFFDSCQDMLSFFEFAFKPGDDIQRINMILKLNQNKKIFSEQDMNQAISLVSGIPYPSFSKNLIPIVFACDNNYAPYLVVLMTSIIENADKHYNYEFIIMESRMSQFVKDRIGQEFSKYSNVIIKFINPRNIIGKIEFHLPNYYSEETYYRLFMQTIFQFYTKLIYIDVDTIVLQDISQLFNINVENCLFAATLNAGTVPHYKNNWKVRGVLWRDYLTKQLKMKNPNNYFQAGVLVVNVPELRTFDLQNKALKKLKALHPVLVDQDILNGVCEGHVKRISLRWDFLDAFRKEWKTDEWIDYLEPMDREDYIEAAQNPYIVHYAGQYLRPWKNTQIKYADIWWKYARKTSFYEELLMGLHKPVSSASSLNPYNIPFEQYVRDAVLFPKLYLDYLRCRLLSHLTWGNKKTHYKNKKEAYHKRIRFVRAWLSYKDR